jgi:CHAT domain-containing protein
MLAGADAALELRQAQTCLRDATAGALAEHFAKEEAAFTQNCVPSEAASEYFSRFASQDPRHQPFAHPNYCAGFTFSGA